MAETRSMGTLYVVATPIGNLEDVTLRALRVLAEVELVLAEDTRRTRSLLTHHGLSTRLVSLHAHNEAARIDSTLAQLEDGVDVALVSDAGTPLISDPGGRLVAAARDAGCPVVPVPGASAVLAAIAGCGLQVASFTFVGFLPRAAGARRKRLEAERGRAEALVLFESPRRLRATLEALRAAFGDGRRACVARELTKLHETFVRGTLAELAEAFPEPPRGEVTIVVEGASQSERLEAAPALDGEALDAEIERRVAAGERPKAIAAALAERAILPKRALYARVVELEEAAAEESP
jgi:16S rRNA (cytidine1402-2'-O)-methyltransferase